MTHKILLDTDIGSDIDDAIALAYLLAQPINRVEVFIGKYLGLSLSLLAS